MFPKMRYCVFALVVQLHSEITNVLGQSLWPKPQYVKIQKSYAILSPNLKISYDSKCEIVNQAIKRYTKTINEIDCVPENCPSSEIRNLIRVKASGDEVDLSALKIRVSGVCDKYPSENMNEHYELNVTIKKTVGTIHLTSPSVWGILRGFETLTQLIYEKREGNNVKLAINGSTIKDFPRFKFRLLMLDTARHFLSRKVILQNLDAMVMNKLNVFHWHIVDDQSFPFVSAAFPDLSGKGAYTPQHVYSPDDVAFIVEYARVRGIRVMPEFDTPGHTKSWGKGQSGLLTPCYSENVRNGKFGPIDPTTKKTYAFLETFFGEVTDVFPDKYFHMGGDEVSSDCWASNPDIVDFMIENNFGTDFSKLQAFYFKKAQPFILNKNKTVLCWQEVFDHKALYDKSTIVHVWKKNYKPELSAVTKAGYKCILSSCWYLNYISYGLNWKTYYDCDPQAFEGTPAQKDLVIGGGATMWGEFIDGTNIKSTTWPRASAVAERLWSASTVKNVEAAAPRLEAHRCRMMKRGIPAQSVVIGPGFCPCDPFI